MTPDSPAEPPPEPEPKPTPEKQRKRGKKAKSRFQQSGAKRGTNRKQAKANKVAKAKKPAKPKLDRTEKLRQQGADYLRWLFRAGLEAGAQYDEPGAAVLMRNAYLRDMLMIPRNVVPLIAQPVSHADKTDKKNELGELHLWLLQADWPEFIGPAGMEQLADAADLPTMLDGAAPEIGPALETALDGGREFPRPRRPEAAQIGLYASALAVHGRYKRALALLHWLDTMRPGQPATAKRLANICWLVGNHDAALRWLRTAFSAAPDNALLHLALAIRLTEGGDDGEGQGATALAHIERAAALWPELDLEIGGDG